MRRNLIAIVVIVVLVFIAVVVIKQFVGCGKEAASKEKVEVQVEMVSPGNGMTVMQVPVSQIDFKVVAGEFVEGKIEVRGPNADGEQSKYSGKVSIAESGIVWTPDIAGGLAIPGIYEVKVSGKNIRKETFGFTVPRQEKEPETPKVEPGTTPAPADRRKTLDELEAKYPVGQ